jgi:hypothetical protein
MLEVSRKDAVELKIEPVIGIDVGICCIGDKKNNIFQL